MSNSGNVIENVAPIAITSVAGVLGTVGAVALGLDIASGGILTPLLMAPMGALAFMGAIDTVKDTVNLIKDGQANRQQLSVNPAEHHEQVQKMSYVDLQNKHMSNQLGKKMIINPHQHYSVLNNSSQNTLANLIR